MPVIQKPSPGEYAPYTLAYIDLVPDDGKVLDHLQTAMQTTRDLIQPQSPALLVYRFAPNEWTIKEILVHVIDTERIMAYRALRFARNDTTILAGFDQDEYVANSRANQRSIGDILDEYTAVRHATLAFFQSLDELTWLRTGQSNNHPMSVRAAAYVIAGHELHHLKSINENYLSGTAAR